MSKQFYLTTPLYYVNDEPHIGHAYTTILADVLARYHRLFGDDVHFLTGLDEHGQKVAAAASKLKRNPQVHCDEMVKIWKDVWEKIDISYDDFIRTTEPRHERVVAEILNNIYQKGDIYREQYEGWYSVFEERFFTEKDLVDGKDPLHGRPVERISETNYFFRMSKYQDWLIDYYNNHPDAVVPEFRLNEVLGFLRNPLGDLCISRPKSRLTWGIPIPWDDEYVTYVWFDALINYYSATVAPPDNLQVKWPAQVHLIAKDILTTHAVYWPIMLHAAGFDPPERILSHGYWLAKDDAKMSKSVGNVIRPFDLASRYSSDALRYVLMREMVVGQDASFSEDTLIRRMNSDLANDLGNLFSRLAKLWQSGKYGAVRPPDIELDSIPPSIREQRAQMKTKVYDEIRAIKPHAAIEEIMQVVRGLNQLIEQLKPWELVKTVPEQIRLPMAWTLDCVYEIAELLRPVMPRKMVELKERIKGADGWINPQVGKPLFPRIKTEKQPVIETEIKAEKTGEYSRQTFDNKEITIEDFSRLDLRIAVVKDARRVENSDKLLALQIDIGSETRQIIAGIAESYTPEEMVGKRIAVVVNLKPVEIRGELSHGMMLAAGKKDSFAVLSPDRDMPPGVKIR